jgi:UDP-glucuronate decarboxylase
MNARIVEEDLESIIRQPLPWEKLAGKTVLISGAGGFIASFMAMALLRLNDVRADRKTKVIGVVRDREKALSRFSGYTGRDDLRILARDIRTRIDIGEGIDYIIHAASQASPRYYGSDPVGTLSANVFGTAGLLESARENRVAGFLFFSSSEVYGRAGENSAPIREDAYGYLDPLDIRSCYAESKRMGENMCVSWSRQYGVPVKIVRPFHTYGPGLDLEDGRVFADFVSDIVHERDIAVKGSGRARRAFCYLADAVAGFFAVLLKGQNGEAYNVGNDMCEVSITELAHILAELFPEKHLRVVRGTEAESPGYIGSRVERSCPDISKARSLGWEPVTGIKEGFLRTVRSYL